MVVRIELMSPSAEGNFDLRYVSIDDAQARKPKTRCAAKEHARQFCEVRITLGICVVLMADLESRDVARGQGVFGVFVS